MNERTGRPTLKPTYSPATSVERLPPSSFHVPMGAGGRSLDRNTQTEMSARFGHDFSQVRVHTDAQAAEAAQGAGASAFTLGNDVFFGEGQYAPGSSDGERLLAHELTHVVQQARSGPGDPSRSSRRDDASEREAHALAERAVSGHAVQVQATPQAALARDEKEEGGWFSSLASGAGSLASSAWGGTKTAAGAVYNGYEKATDFKTLQSGIKTEGAPDFRDKKEDAAALEQAKGHWYEPLVTGGLNGGIDALEKASAANNQKMVDDSEGHWYSGLAKGSAWLNNGMTQAAGGVTKGLLDLTIGVGNTFAHPIDAAAGIEGILEHNMTIPGLGTTLKAGHALYDLAAKDKPEERQYGSSAGEIANHLFNPMQQMEDDTKYDTRLAAGILAPDEMAKKGMSDKPGEAIANAFKDKPVEAGFRALTNIVPAVLGMGEATAGGEAAEAANAGKGVKSLSVPELPPVSEPLPSTQPRPSLPAPDTVPNPAPGPKPNFRELPPEINPNDPRVEPPSVPAPDTVPDAPAPDTRREIPKPARVPEPAPDTIPNPATGPESEIPSRPPTIEPLPESTPDPYIRPYEEGWLRTPWRMPVF